MGQSLRERNKARRADAIIRAAYRLFAERGYDATTVADIAAAAEVSPRTVALYFPSKQDIALTRFGEAADELTAALRARQPHEKGTEVIARWLHENKKDADPELMRLCKLMFAVNPELNALRSARLAGAITEGAAVIADQLGSPPGDPAPRLAAIAAAAVIMELSDIPPGPDRETAITAGLRFLEAGISALGNPGTASG